MPSTIAWPNLPQGAQAVVNSSDNRTFHATISGLPAPATTYNLTIEAHSIPWGVIGTATGTLTTTAPPTEPPTGSGAPGTHSRVQGPLHVRIVNEPAFVPTEDKVGFTTITVQLTNQGRTPIEGLRVLPSSTLDRPCIQTMEFCRSNPPRVLDSLISSSLGPLVVLEPGRSVLATLTFPRAFATPGGILGSPTGVLSLMVDHGAVPTSDPFVLDVVLPPPPAQLAVSSPVADRHAAIDFEADLLNYGPGAAIGVVLELIFDSPVDVSTAQAYGGLAGNGTFFQCRNTRRSQQVECSLPDFPPGFISAPGLMHLSVSLNELRRAPITVTLRLGSRTSDPDLADNTRTFVLPAR
jgi:hypothetical protein